MREIKFKFWDTDNKEMSEVCKLGDDLRWLHSDMHIPLQYTGLKDKNWAEIYEGDIVRATYPEENMSCVAEVVWDSWGAKFQLYDYESMWDMWQDEGVSELEIIGNIYEENKIITLIN